MGFELPLSAAGDECLTRLAETLGRSHAETLAAGLSLLDAVTDHLRKPCTWVALGTEEGKDIVLDVWALYAKDCCR